MTYDARERSVQDGAPIELYRFVIGTRVYRYTSADEDQVIGADTWTRLQLERGKIEASAEQSRNSLTIRAPRDMPVADMYRVTSPTGVIAVTVLRRHRGDSETAVIWNGRLVNVEWGGGIVTLNCEPISASLQRVGLRRLYQRQCPHVLYGNACGVVRATHNTVTTVTASSGLVLTVAALATKPYAGGFVEWLQADDKIERRFISSFSGLALTLSQPFQGITNGTTVTVSPGCDHTTATCSGVYSNLPNYGGFPFIPTKNPFDGSPVY